MSLSLLAFLSLSNVSEEYQPLTLTLTEQPIEILAQIANHSLEHTCNDNIMKMCQIDKRFKSACENEDFWKVFMPLVWEKLGVPEELRVPQPPPTYKTSPLKRLYHMYYSPVLSKLYRFAIGDHRLNLRSVFFHGNQIAFSTDSHRYYKYIFNGPHILPTYKGAAPLNDFHAKLLETFLLGNDNVEWISLHIPDLTSEGFKYIMNGLKNTKSTINRISFIYGGVIGEKEANEIKQWINEQPHKIYYHPRKTW